MGIEIQRKWVYPERMLGLIQSTALTNILLVIIIAILWIIADHICN